jgi:hypothetical protein
VYRREWGIGAVPTLVRYEMVAGEVVVTGRLVEGEIIGEGRLEGFLEEWESE